jgi:cation diffusion facilitator family transporter
MGRKSSIDLRARVNAMRLVLFLSALVMLVKFAAWYYSGSRAILSDALESLINIATSLFTLYSLVYSARLRDSDHPYGHGKVEYLSVGFEGALITGTGVFIIVNSVRHLIHPEPLQNIDIGMLLTAVSTTSMWAIGRFLQRKGKLLGALPLVADGKHFAADAITSAGIIIGLLLYKLTNWIYIDPLLAILLAFHIMASGYQLVRESVDRLMDKADIETIEQLAIALSRYRKSNWIDIHNLRLQKFGHYLHVDCHLTLPFYMTLEQVHDEIKSLEDVLNRDFGNHIELFVHTDPCQQIPCEICAVGDCTYRKLAKRGRVEWNKDNLMLNRKHSLDSSNNA